MNKAFKKIKDIYDSYKIAVWILPFMSVSVFDRLYNFWNVPARLEADEIRFVEQRKKDSVLFQNHVEYSSFVNKQLNKEIKNLKDSLILITKHKRK